MGGILEQQPGEEPFYLEVRNESFYVNTHPDPERFVFAGRQRGDGFPEAPEELRVPRAHLRAFVACLERITKQRSYRMWTKEVGETHPDPFLIAPLDDDVELTGAVWVPGASEDWTPVQGIELLYRDVPFLIRELTAVI